MSKSQPLERIEFAHKEVERYRDDVDDWKQAHDALSNDCWVWEDLIAKASFLYRRMLILDEELQKFLLAEPAADGSLQAALRNVLAEWLNTSLLCTGYTDRVRKLHGQVRGAEELIANIKEAQAILTPDDVFFDDPEMWSMRDEAVASHRAGETEPLLDDECVH